MKNVYNMKNVYKLMILASAAIAASAQDTTANSYTQTNLVSDLTGMATVTDAHLKNPWGLSRSASSDWWVSDNDTGVSTLYNGAGAVNTLVVTIPTATGTGTGTPTGTVAVGSKFVFVTLDGTISEWSSGTKAVRKVNNHSKNASYTGVTTAKNGTVLEIYVANSNGGIEAYTTAFAPVTLGPGAFTDSKLPAGSKPYGIQSVGKKIYVTFTSPSGVGSVDAFNSTGKLLLRVTLLPAGFSEPWGIAESPSTWGAFPSALLVGDVGSGKIAAFSPTAGTFLGFLQNSAAMDIANPGLWALHFGSGAAGSGATTSLYFAAGINGYANGLFGMITPN